MRTALAAALSAFALAAPIGAAHAQTAISVQVSTPQFGVRIGSPFPVFVPAPVVVPAPVFVTPAAPVYVPPVPVFVSAPPVVVVPPRWVAPSVYPVAYPVGYGTPVRRHKHGPWQARPLPAPGFVAYGR